VVDQDHDQQRLADHDHTDPTGQRSTKSGPGRILIAVYGLFAIAATSRAIVQLATDYAEAPLAYALSLLSGVIYIAATISLALGGPVWRRVAWITILVELVGVLAVGTASILDPDAFPRATVWSTYGIGYGFVPLVLPCVGLFWMWRTRGQH
jgi:hypothetical protein